MEFQIENNTESELAEEKVREALNRSAEALPKEDDLEVVIDYSDFDFIKEKMNGVMGMPRGSSKIEMSFHPESSNWPEFLASMTCHEFAHTFYSEK